MRYLVGIGTYSMYDDSIGIRVIENIAQKEMDQGFMALDLSGNLFNLLNYLTDETEHMVIIDTALMDEAAGSVKFFAPEMAMTRKELDGFSTHEGDVLKILQFAKETGHFIPPITIMGIQPKDVKNEFGVSKELESKIDDYTTLAIKKVLEEVPCTKPQ